MQKFCFCFFSCLLISSNGISQSQNEFELDHLPVAGDTLLTGWKYMAGDNPAYATIGYDDRNWQTGPFEKTDISFFIRKHPHHLGWFRLTLKIPDSIFASHLSASF